MNPRAALRLLVRELLEVHPPFASFTVLKAWPYNVSPEILPVITVATPRESVEASTGDDVNRVTDLQVHALVKADVLDEFEDELDALADEIEAVVMAALRDRGQPFFELVSVEIGPEGDGAERIGSVKLQFRETRFEPEIC